MFRTRMTPPQPTHMTKKASMDIRAPPSLSDIQPPTGRIKAPTRAPKKT